MALQVALVNFASNVYPGRIDYIDHVLDAAVQQFTKTETTEVDRKYIKDVKKLLTLPLESLSLQILELNSFAALMTFLGKFPVVFRMMCSV